MANAIFLHSGAAAATEVQVFEVETPQATQSWQPVAHAELLSTVERHVFANGWRVDSRAYALQHNGARMFGVWSLSGGMSDKDYALTLGIRNSHDKVFSAGLAVGSRVFVCDNLAFSAEIVVIRRHTRFIMRDLDKLVATAIGRVGEHRATQAMRIDAYKQMDLLDEQVHDIVVRGVDAQVISNAAVPHVLKQWRKPDYEDFQARNAWSLFNAFTHVLKDVNPMELAPRTTRLHGLLDGVSGVIIQPSTN